MYWITVGNLYGKEYSPKESMNTLEGMLGVVVDFHQIDHVPYEDIVIRDSCGTALNIGWLANPLRKVYIVEILKRIRYPSKGNIIYFEYDGCIASIEEDMNVAIEKARGIEKDVIVLEVELPNYHRVYSMTWWEKD